MKYRLNIWLADGREISGEYPFWEAAARLSYCASESPVSRVEMVPAQ